MATSMAFEQIITGAEGFIGSHLCAQLDSLPEAATIATLDLLPAERRMLSGREVDIRRASALEGLARGSSRPVLIHLAAVAEAVTPFASMRELSATNVDGTINVLEAFDPARVVFASSSAVYGTVPEGRARPRPGAAAACGAYGVSKRLGELVCSQQGAERGRVVASLRLGNVVGPRCRGLVPYLVAHAVRHPDGSVPARLRGKGRLVRDYVTVEYVVEIIRKAVALPLDPGREAVFNLGSGTGMTNEEVAGMVAGALERQGLRLRLDFDRPVAPGESERVVLDVEETTRALGVPPPAREAVVASIEAATIAHLKAMRQPSS